MGRQYQPQSKPASAPIRPEPVAARTPTDPLAAQQSAYGNQALQRLLESRTVQAKLTVTPPTDAFEQEADQVASRVVQGGNPGATPTASALQRVPEVRRSAKDEKKKDEVKRAAAKDEKKKDDKVKRAPAKDEKKKDEKVKRAPEADEEKKPEEDESVQRRASSESVPEVSSEVERSIQGQKSSGQPLPDSVRSDLEPRFGHDLSQVRLHTDSRAAAAARELKAQAFTHGQDIYFADHRYQPHSDAGRHLLAHEITHTLQQSGGSPLPETVGPTGTGGPAVSRAPEAGLVQREGAAAPATKAGTDLKTGLLEGETITFDFIEIPSFKLQEHRSPLYTSRAPLGQKKQFNRGNTNQRGVWKETLSAETSKIQEKLKKRHETATAADKDKSAATATGTYYFKSPGGKTAFIGDLPTIASEMTLPTWTASSEYRRFDVDHIVELQLADWGGEGWANTVENMELLDSSKNRSSGSVVKNKIAEKVNAFIQSTNGEHGKSVSEIKDKYHVRFNAAKGSGAGEVGPDDFWTKKDIVDGKQVDDPVKLEVVNASNLGGDGKVAIFPSPAGGVPKHFPASGAIAGEAWPKPFRVTAAEFKTSPDSVADANFGSVTVELPEGHKQFKPLPPESMPLTRIPGAQHAGSLDKAMIRAKLASLRHKKASPITVNEPEITERGITVTGAIQPELPIFAGKAIDFELAGDELTASVEFGVGDLKVPKPFTVSGSTIRIFASTERGLGAEGQVDFAIERVGKGFLRASVGTTDGLNVVGEFNFDSTLFDPAMVKLGYENNEFKGSGTLGIPPGKVSGIKTATVTANYEAGTFKAAGSAELTIPGIDKGNLSIEYSEAAGLKIEGDFSLKNDLPGLKGGSAKVSLAQGEGGWKVKADITAQPAIPGFDTEIKGSYEDGAITLSATAGYSRGMLNGSLTLGATNRAVDGDGNPTGPPGKKFSAFGTGTVTMKLTSWLQGTVGVQIKPNAELVLKGKLALPSSVDLFPKKEVNKTLFSVDTIIPIFGPVIATIGGNLQAYASFGPGQLKDLSVEVTYNPDHEEDTVVRGGGRFYVPADAGLRLAVSGGIGATAVVASVGGKLELGGSLGLHAEVDVGVDVNWTPKSGVDVKGTARASAEPQFLFDITGVAYADLGAGPISYRLYEKKWQLAKFAFGSGLRLGVTLPIHYIEGKSFDVKYEDIQIEKPDISMGDVLKSLMAKLT